MQGISEKVQKAVKKFADFIEFLSNFNEFGQVMNSGSKRRSFKKTSKEENYKNSLFSCGEELPQIPIHDYIMTIF